MFFMASFHHLMSAKDLTFDQLRLLVDIYRSRSLAVAADRRGLSLSTASRMLRTSREFLGDELFTRSGQNMHPTSRMHELAGFIEHMIGEFDMLSRQEFRFRPERIERTVRIAALDCIYSVLIAPAVEKARAIAPGIRFIVEPLSLGSFDALRAGFLDLFFFGWNDDAVPENIERQKLLEADYRIGMRRGHPLEELWRRKGRLTREDLAPWSIVSLATPYTRSEPTATMAWLDAVDYVSEVAMPYHFSMAMHVMESDMIGEFCTPFMRMLECRMPGITSVPYEGFSNYRWTPTIYWHRRTHSDAALQWFRGLVALEARRVVREEAEDPEASCARAGIPQN